MPQTKAADTLSHNIIGRNTLPFLDIQQIITGKHRIIWQLACIYRNIALTLQMKTGIPLGLHCLLHSEKETFSISQMSRAKLACAMPWRENVWIIQRFSISQMSRAKLACIMPWRENVWINSSLSSPNDGRQRSTLVAASYLLIGAERLLAFDSPPSHAHITKQSWLYPSCLTKTMGNIEKMNVFDKPNEQSQIYLYYAVARKRLNFIQKHDYNHTGRQNAS